MHGFTKLIQDVIPMIRTKMNPKLHATHFIAIAIGFLAFFITITTNYTILEIIFSLVFFIPLLSSQYYSSFSANKKSASLYRSSRLLVPLLVMQFTS